MPDTEPFNPYAAPKTTDLLAPNADQIIYDGESLMIPKRFTFPAICLKTGAVNDLLPPRRRKLSWYPPLLALLLILNVLIFLIVAAFVSKRGEIYFYLSREAARKRRNVLLRNWMLLALSIVLGAVGIANQNPMLIGVAGLLVLAALILGIVASRFLWAKRIDATHIWLRGVPDEIARALAVSHGRPNAA